MLCEMLKYTSLCRAWNMQWSFHTLGITKNYTTILHRLCQLRMAL